MNVSYLADMYDCTEENALAAMEALRSENESKARESQTASSAADKTTVTDGDMTFAGNTTTATAAPTQRTAVPKKKVGKPKLSAKEKKERSVRIQLPNSQH